MKAEWLAHCLRLSTKSEDFYSGARKIITRHRLEFMDLWDDEDPLILEDAGYTKSKMSHLRRLYMHDESIEVAVKLWNIRRTKTAYGSVCFTTFNHFQKNSETKKSKRASVMGPCIQSVVITQIKGGKKGKYMIDAFYRTTELFKKFPADLVFLRDELLKDFDFSGMEFEGLTCHFANITLHPQYFVTLIPHMEDPLKELERIKSKDRFFYDWTCKWTARYLCEEHLRGIEKFAQAMRVKMDADARIKGKRRKLLTAYLRENHPGHRSAYQAPEEDEE